MLRARLGLNARAWARLGQARASDSSGPSPSPGWYQMSQLVGWGFSAYILYRHFGRLPARSRGPAAPPCHVTAPFVGHPAPSAGADVPGTLVCAPNLHKVPPLGRHRLNYSTLRRSIPPSPAPTSSDRSQALSSAPNTADLVPLRWPRYDGRWCDSRSCGPVVNGESIPAPVVASPVAASRTRPRNLLLPPLLSLFNVATPNIKSPLQGSKSSWWIWTEPGSTSATWSSGSPAFMPDSAPSAPAALL
ncbi:hypothetical protein DFH09DRAFT_1068632 [Mycena vulgaris]|nr:hypothetical protein DFH09DRAFT_1068632 [Mycena vulgaris]